MTAEEFKELTDKETKDYMDSLKAKSQANRSKWIADKQFEQLIAERVRLGLL